MDFQKKLEEKIKILNQLDFSMKATQGQIALLEEIIQEEKN